MRAIDADKVIEKLKEHKSLFCKNRDEFRTLSDKDKARVDEIDTCIAELVNAEEVPHAQLSTNLAEVGTDCISRQAAVDALAEDMPQTYTPDGSHPADEGIFMAQEIYADCIQTLRELPSTQPEIVRCKDCKYWNSGSCEYHEHVVNCQDYWVGDIETEAEHFCGYAKRRDVTA